MARAVPLFSGSKGNSYYIGTASEGVLIDAGRSCRRIECSLNEFGIDIKTIGAVLITHEHIDHCSGLRVFAKKHGLRVYASEGTLRALEMSGKLDPTIETSVIEDSISVGNMAAFRINTPHDAAESCCYQIMTADGKSALIATDMGRMTDDVRSAAVKSDFVVLESNHDVDMLKTGPYPFQLKRRILSDLGHLSNESCAAELAEIVKNGAMRLVLGHLSEQNNTPRLAFGTALTELERAGLRFKSDYTLDVAPPVNTSLSVIF